jgi:hypothetical protein
MTISQISPVLGRVSGSLQYTVRYSPINSCISEYIRATKVYVRHSVTDMCESGKFLVAIRNDGTTVGIMWLVSGTMNLILQSDGLAGPTESIKLELIMSIARAEDRHSLYGDKEPLCQASLEWNGMNSDKYQPCVHNISRDNTYLNIFGI